MTVVLSANYETNPKEARMELRRQTFVRVNNAQALGLSLVLTLRFRSAIVSHQDHAWIVDMLWTC